MNKRKVAQILKRIARGVVASTVFPQYQLFNNILVVKVFAIQHYDFAAPSNYIVSSVKSGDNIMKKALNAVKKLDCNIKYNGEGKWFFYNGAIATESEIEFNGETQLTEAIEALKSIGFSEGKII